MYSNTPPSPSQEGRLIYFAGVFTQHAASLRVDGKEGKGKNNTLFKDACEYKPIRDALAHTSRLTRVAKNKLNTTYENIKARIVGLLNMA